MTRSFFRRLAVSGLVLLGGASCASERAPINRVQANALDKSFFVGADLSDPADNPEFYYRPTVVDVDYGDTRGELFTAGGGTIARVKFEISEDLLVARLTYERVVGTTGAGTPLSPDQNSGQIVAAFKIQSHFDIKRSYNPTTGEELNIVEENTTDSPWYARKYMRVDWSQNLITDAYQFDTLAALTAFDDAFVYEPVAYSVADPTDPDAPAFDPASNYFDITNKVFVTPQKLDTPFGSIPACYLSPDFLGGNGPTGNCNPTEVKVRLSFRRVVSDDYEPVNWDGQRQQMFGMFTTGTINPDRLGYDRNYGIVDDQWYRFVQRHNIWKQSHYRDAQGNVIPCYTAETTPVGALPSRDELLPDGTSSPDGTDDECEAAGAGSRCDQFSHACTLPYAQRVTTTTPFYYGPHSDPSLFESSAQALAQWDEALRHAVQTARYTECIRVSGGVTADVIASCKAAYDPSVQSALTSVPPVFVFCHNPVAAGDDAACGAPGLIARIGDLRYNMIDIIQNPQNASPWGVMADAVDPITGEVVAASVNLWNSVTDIAAQNAIDSMRWYLGELSNADVANANYTQPLTIANQRSPQAASESPPLLDSAAVGARLASLDSRLNDGTKLAVPPMSAGSQAILDWAEAQTRQKYGNRVLGSGNAGIDTRMTGARGSAVESQLLTKPYLHLAGLDPSAQPSDIGTNLASPLRGNFAQFLLDFERQRQSRLAALGSCIAAAPEPSSVVDWAVIMNQKFPLADEDPSTPGVQASPAAIAARNDKWRDYIRKHITVGVIEHELGHSMGLEHNFTSSFDAMNFRPQYWQLRTQNGSVTQACTATTADGSNCVGPRWSDPITQAERDGLIWRWQQTSVMDYPGDLTQDTLDIGAYDRAAIRMAYADVADVWDDATVRCKGSASGTANCTTNGATVHGLLDGFGGIVGPLYADNTTQFHYSELNKRLKLIRNCQPANTSPPADWDEAKDGVYSPAFDGHIVADTACDAVPTDYVPYRELQPDSGGFVQQPTVTNGIQRNIDALGRVRRPYMFGSDDYADIGNLAVLRHDNGADAFEVTHYLISQYEDRHVFQDYRRNRSDFSLKKSFMYSFQRQNAKLMEITKGFGLENEVFQGTGAFEVFSANDGQFKASALAASMAFDHFARILTRPNSGEHFLDNALHPLGTSILRSTDQLPNVNMPRSAPGSAGMNLIVPDGSTGIGGDVAWGGRLLNNTLDQSKGYYVVQYDLALGSYYDKTLAMYLMSDSQDRFVSESRDDFQDGRYRNTSFATLFPDGFRRLLANTLTEDDDIKGWRVASTKGAPNLDAQGSPTQPMGFRAWWTKNAPQVCWPTGGRLICQEFPSDTTVANAVPKESIALDSESGFEVQKFAVFFAMLNLPESWKQDWVDMMRIWEIGSDSSPSFDPNETVAWRDPLSGDLFESHSYGKEVIDGKTVERGIAARVLEWMNTLTRQAYVVDEVATADAMNNPSGALVIEKYPDNTACPPGIEVCKGQPIQRSPQFALRVTNYKSVIDYMHETAAQFGFYGPQWRGVY